MVPLASTVSSMSSTVTSAVMTWGALGGLKYTDLMPQPAATTRPSPTARRQPDNHCLRLIVLMFTVS